MSNDEKHANQTEALAKGQNFYPNEKYVRLPASQICRFN
jgi:hypothetical protein